MQAVMEGTPQSLIMHAWTDYRIKQEIIMNLLMHKCEYDDDLREFVRNHVWAALQVQLNTSMSCSEAIPDESEGWNNCENWDGAVPYEAEVWKPADAVFSHSSISPAPSTVETSFETPPDDALRVLAQLMKECKEEAKEQKNDVDLLKRIMNKQVDPSKSKRDGPASPQDGGKGEPKKTTVVVRMPGTRHMTPQDALKYLSGQCDVVGGRDIDFLYCPQDFSKHSIKGYAIVNFREAVKAEAMEALGEECSWAKWQGFDLNASNFLKRHGCVRNEKLRPLIWLSHDSTPICLWGGEKTSGV